VEKGKTILRAWNDNGKQMDETVVNEMALQKLSEWQEEIDMQMQMEELAANSIDD